jgi:hypothetical protein
MEREIHVRKTIADICIKLLEVQYSNADVVDIGNEIGFAVGTSIQNMTQEEITDFITGFKHGVSLTNGTH